MIIAVDFDGTLAETEYPKIIKPNLYVVNTMIVLRQKGHKVILNTCRHGKDLNEAVEFCKEYGLEFDYINENVPELIEKYGDSRKIYADFYIDDHSMRPENLEFTIKWGNML